MKNEYGIIYKITSKIDKKVYIGQTTTTFRRRYDCGGVGVERVYRSFLSCIRNERSYNQHLMFAIEKYGFENFHISERFDTAQTQEELDEKERYWIAHYNATNPLFGYNCESGGNPNKKASEQTRARQSAAQRKRFSNKANSEYLRNRRHSDETKAKISASKRGTPGRPMSDDNLEKLNEAKRKPIICLTTGETFYYMKDALEKYGIKSQGNLSLACHGKRLHCGKLEDGTKLKWSLWGG